LKSSRATRPADHHVRCAAAAAIDVDDGAASGELPTGLDVDVQRLRAQQAALDQRGDGERVVHGCGLAGSEDVAVRGDARGDQAGRRSRDRRRRWRRARRSAAGDQRLLTGVERHQQVTFDAGAQHRSRRLGIGPHVEVRGRRDVADGVDARERDDLAERRRELRLARQGQGEVGQRRGRHER
jgi:hypothetical protein